MSRPDITPAGRSFGNFNHIPTNPARYHAAERAEQLGYKWAIFDRGQIDEATLMGMRHGGGNRDNIVTNRPPAFTADARAAWVQAREEAALERLLGGAP